MYVCVCGGGGEREEEREAEILCFQSHRGPRVSPGFNEWSFLSLQAIAL